MVVAVENEGERLFSPWGGGRPPMEYDDGRPWAEAGIGPAGCGSREMSDVSRVFSDTPLTALAPALPAFSRCSPSGSWPETCGEHTATGFRGKGGGGVGRVADDVPGTSR